MNYFLGIKVDRINSGISLTQRKFTKELLADAGITDYKNVVTPLPINLKLTTTYGDFYSYPNYYIYACLKAYICMIV